jgi:hypothetical protein
MSTVHMYLFSKSSDEKGFCKRAIKELKKAKIIDSVEDGDIIYSEESDEDLDIEGSGGDRVIIQKTPAAIPEEYDTYGGLCPKCDTDLGDDFTKLFMACLADGMLEEEDKPKISSKTAKCPSCNWIGSFEDVKCSEPDMKFYLRSEYIGIYDTYTDDPEYWKERFEELIPDSIALISHGA